MLDVIFVISMAIMLVNMNVLLIINKKTSYVDGKKDKEVTLLIACQDKRD